MTPEQIVEQLGERDGARPAARLRPDLGHAPYRWIAAVEDQSHEFQLSDADLHEAWERAVQAEVSPWEEPEQGRVLRLTRDGRTQATYADLVQDVGRGNARWALLRSSDEHQIDCAVADLAGLTLRNPLFAVLLAVSRLGRGRDGLRAADQGDERGNDKPGEPELAQGEGLAAALTAQWPLILADAARTGRSRPVALHLEALARAFLDRPNDRTDERLARAGRIVLVAGLSSAGLRAPDRI